MQTLFRNRKLLIATQHNKERVIAPLFEKGLAVKCFTTGAFDTDTLGTFSGEIQRKNDALTTLRKKCILAMEKNHCDLVIASEGSFGVHPSVFIAAADDELLMLMDAKNDLEIVVREVSMDTNFAAATICNEADLTAFAQRVQFPSHGLLLRPAEDDYRKVIKGITEAADLKFHFEAFKNEFGSVYVETDMRANFNPSRMRVIEKTAAKLLAAVQSQCPNCETPGFTVSSVVPGLPCLWCHQPTASTLSFIYQCKKCKCTREHLYPHQKKNEDPAYCNYCNP